MNLGKLYLIPRTITDNSIGNSIPPDVLKITQELTHYIAERAKTTRQYLKEANISRPIQEIHISELNKHQPKEGINEMLEPCFHGHDIGLMSEAGCPAVADPGSLVVMTAHENGIEVVPLVGPSSILLALMASGLNGQKFIFHGYIPYKDKGEFKRNIRQIENDAQKGTTQIFIETPYRNQSTFEQLLKSLKPSLKLSIAVDILGKSEKIQTFTIQEWKKVQYDIPKLPAIFLVGD